MHQPLRAVIGYAIAFRGAQRSSGDALLSPVALRGHQTRKEF